jgi:hypothetical protein
MQTFDGELEKLIHSGELDRETALSYATNRTNLELRLSTQGGAEGAPSIPLAPAAPGVHGHGRSRPLAAEAHARHGGSEMDDLIER